MDAVIAIPLQLRPMRADDLQAVMEVEPRAYDFCWSEGIFRDCLRVGYSCWVLTSGDGGELIGYGVMSLGVGECHVLNLTIRPECQGQGFGRHLLNAMLNIARERQAETVFLEVRPSNTPAVGLYRTLGFNEVGIRKRYYPAGRGREDALVLAMQL
ncbi:ribosomal protein S18-alanine N-acetyltransferase [Ectothiorhodospira lacustris]|uniref:ribosomal protein S18-alanine N-acetyltransferase n=1 Tax=Ectothiorhodospira lacustris TaxID=2899127 RepID=UPI001EE8D770|nr:ribosomal protein S18-alanine N-acetyltransferase [Ectothiorhodospira lacustris]MCG5499966.1 ribosomal protein S18-alanine N-acetyltransferase [Ectothiorhodospira lacustris]MCG5510938.1 ribosomal protein S18-alanine N-acetyltransferase [Ectothiorhodospira lacustris]MCG5522670.1 ribosomal protein S18-alanine N-acetyltransferase [Ectothiorhodospira lacustris]